MHMHERLRTREIALCFGALALIHVLVTAAGFGAGRRASIVFRDSSQVIAEVVSVQDSTLTVANMRYDTRVRSNVRLPDTSSLSLAKITKLR